MASFPWAYVFANAVWILGLAVVMAALGWHEFLAHTRKKKLGELLRGDSFLKPLYGGLALVTGGLALSVRVVTMAVGFAVASFGFLYFFLRRCVGRSGNLSENQDENLAEEDVDSQKTAYEKRG